jgi:hypothetical protein
MIFLGVDIGQRRDPTAFAVAEAVWRRVDGRREAHFLVRHLERLPLGTPYPEVVGRIETLTRRVGQRGGERPILYVDATGVGQPVVDHLRNRSQIGMVVAVYFTGGEARRESWEGDRLRVALGKEYLVSRLQALLGTGRLHLPRGQEMVALTKELLNYELRVDANGHARAGAFRVGTHDDLVTAIGLAVQVDDVDWPARRTIDTPPVPKLSSC